MKGYMETVQEELEHVLLEQLTSTLTQDVNIRVQEKKPKTTIEVGQLTDQYMVVRQYGERNNECFFGHEEI